VRVEHPELLRKGKGGSRQDMINQYKKFISKVREINAKSTTKN